MERAKLKINKPLAILLILAFIRGSIYAFFLPPWALTDEEQHVDYIQSIVEKGKIPVVGVDYISDEIMQSVLDTKRHERFMWATPPIADQSTWGLEGHSYEGYQPPLFYMLSAPVYWLMPGDILNKLLALRIWMVFLSLITVWALYRVVALLVKKPSHLPFIAASILIFIPERTISVSRVSNDVLLEVLAAIFILAFIHIINHGLSNRNLLGLSIIFSLGLLTKISFIGMGIFFLFLAGWYVRKENLARFMILASLPIVILVLPWIIRNYSLYNDITGFQGFASIAQTEIQSWGTRFSLSSLWLNLLKSFAHFWLVWWKGSRAAFFYWLIPFYLVLSLTVAIALWRGIQKWRNSSSLPPLQQKIIPAFSGSVIVYLILVLVSFYANQFPAIQGRFLLPIYIPFISLLVWSIHQERYAAPIWVVLLVTLISVDALFLLGNQLRSYYYLSPIEFILEGQPPDLLTAKFALALETFYDNHRPVPPLVYRSLLIAYAASFAAWAKLTFSSLRDSQPITQINYDT